MSFVQETQLLFITTLVIATLIVLYLFNSGRKLIRSDYLFRVALARATEELNKNYSSEGAELIKRMDSDLSAPEFKPSVAFRMANKLRAKDKHVEFYLNGKEQLEVLAWMLGWERMPDQWQANKVKNMRSMSELITIAKDSLDQPRQIVISKLI